MIQPKFFLRRKNVSVSGKFKRIIAEVMMTLFRVVCFLGRVLWTTVSVSFLFVAFGDVALAQGTPAPITVSYDFRNGAQGWQTGFSDYPPATDNGFYQLKAEIRSLPPELGINGTGFYIQGSNHSADLFMFLKRRLGAEDGIVAGRTYELTFKVVFASNAPTGCGGVGGPPGESVWLKAGASPAEPRALLTPPPTDPRVFSHLRMNVDKSNQSQSGIAASVVSNIANGRPCDLFSREYVSLERVHQHTSLVNANSNGELWLLVGTDSGFESLTSIYYQSIDVTLTPLPPPDPVLLERMNSIRAAALDSATLATDPFPVISTRNLFSSAQHTHVTLFAYNLELRQGETLSEITVGAQDEQRVLYDLPVVAVHEVPNFSWIKQVTVKLPDQLKGLGAVLVWINLRGRESNKSLVALQ